MKKFFFTFAVTASVAALSAYNGNPEDIEGVKTVSIDGVEVTWIRDNAEPRIMERTLFSDASDSLVSALGLEDGVPASMSAFLVRKDGQLILFDTGLGAGNSRLTAAFDALGISADDIDCIFLTHLHGDHIGGMLKDGEPVFNNAEVYVAQKEYDGWTAMPQKQNGQVVKTMSLYRERLHLFTEDESLPYGIRQIAAYGHTPGHTAGSCCYLIDNFMFSGDTLMHLTCGRTDFPSGNKKEMKQSVTTGTSERNWVTLFKQYENIEELNRRVLMALVDRILIYENHAIEIVFKYKDEYQQTLEYVLGYADELAIAG